MNKIKIIVLLISLTSLISCGGALLPGSSDPYKKIEYMSTAMAQGRWIPAERYVKEALAIFQERNDKQGIAEAYLAYANYYKYGNWCKFEKDLCPKGSISLPKSVEYSKKSITLFEKLKNSFGVARATFLLANTYGKIGELDKTCKLYDKSLLAYEKSKPQNEAPHVNINYKENFGNMVNKFKNKFC